MRYREQNRYAFRSLRPFIIWGLQRISKCFGKEGKLTSSVSFYGFLAA